MSFKDSLEAEVKKLTEAHEKNRQAYRAALSEKESTNAKVRELCDTASASANELGAARKALEELDRNSPVVEASGEVGA